MAGRHRALAAEELRADGLVITARGGLELLCRTPGPALAVPAPAAVLINGACGPPSP